MYEGIFILKTKVTKIVPKYDKLIQILIKAVFITKTDKELNYQKFVK